MINDGNQLTIDSLLEHGIINRNQLEQFEIMVSKKKEEAILKKYHYWQNKTDKKWYAKLNGKLVKKATEEKMRKRILEFDKEQQCNPTVEQIYNEWLNYKVEYDDIKPATVTRIQKDFKKFFGTLASRKIKQVKPLDIEKFLKKQIVDCKLDSKAYGRLKGIVEGVFDFARKKELVSYRIKEVIEDANISKKSIRSSKKNDDEEVYTNEEITSLDEHLEQIADIYSLGIRLMLKTGIRVGELVALRHEDIQEDGIHIHATETSYEKDGHTYYEIKESPKTEAGIRVVPIPEESKEILNSLATMNTDNEFIFVRNGKLMHGRQIRDKLRRECRNAGIKYRSPHKLRKTYASLLYESNVPQMAVSKLLGHTTPVVTQEHYVRDRSTAEERQGYVNQAFKKVT